MSTREPAVLIAQFAFATVGFAAAIAIGELAYHAIARLR